jgi:DNA-binding CsgD family transcriptional regulator
VRISDNVRSTHSQDGGIVLDIRQGLLFRLNPVGSRMLDLLKQGYSESQIADEISRQFGVSREMVAADLKEFLSHLGRHHLLESEQQDTRHGR